MTRLDKTVISRLLSPFVTVETQRDDALHLVLPLLADDIKKTLWAYILIVIV